MAKFASIRQIIIPFILFFLGYQYIRNVQGYRVVVLFLCAVFLFVVMFGFVERFSYLWSDVSLRNYFDSKNIGVFPNGYPVMFIEPLTFYQEGIDVSGIVRMVSSFLDPINLGHSLTVVLTVVLYEKRLFKQNLIKISFVVILFVALLLTFSKGAMLQLFLVLFLLNKNVSFMLKLSLVPLFVIAVYFAFTLHTGLLLHLIGLINILDHLTLFGNGLATFGNYAFMFAGGDSLNSNVSDTFWGSLIGQIGLIGFILWLLSFKKITSIFPVNHYLTRLLVAQIIVSSISENSFNLLSIFVIMPLIGGYYSIVENEIKMLRQFR